MSRYVPAALVAALLVATGAAFAYTERLKLTPSPILGTAVTKVFSPVCECDTDVATIGFRLRRRDRIDVDIVDGSGRVVRTLVRNRAEPRGVTVEIFWDGRDDAGGVVPQASYRPRVRLDRQRRTIVLPNPIRIDTTPPRFEAKTVRPRVFSPDGDGRNETVVVTYRVDERAQVALYVDGRRQLLRRGTRPQGRLQWFGLVDGERVSPGAYALTLGATDLAGNVSRRTVPVTVIARSVALGRDRIDAVAGGSFAVLVVSDARLVRWSFAGKRGAIRPGTLRLRAPDRPGRYRLVVRANGRADTAIVRVRASAVTP